MFKSRNLTEVLCILFTKVESSVLTRSIVNNNVNVKAFLSEDDEERRKNDEIILTFQKTMAPNDLVEESIEERQVKKFIVFSKTKVSNIHGIHAFLFKISS